MLSMIDVGKFLKGLRTEVEIYVKILVIEPRGALKLSRKLSNDWSSQEIHFWHVPQSL